MLRNLAQAWLERLAELGAAPTDTPEQRLGKSLLIFLVVTLGIGALSVYTVVYLALGLWLPAAIPISYQVVSVVSLVYLARTKDFETFRTVELFGALMLPMAAQWALGGFARSGAVLLWAAWPAIGQLMFEGPKKSVPWFVAYLGLVAVSAAIDPLLPPFAPVLPARVHVLFFTLNVVIVTGSMYLALGYFADQRDLAMQQLNEKHGELQQEQARSESLLLSILPRAVAERLKRNPRALAEESAEATVLFADIVDFTRLSSGVGPPELVGWLNELFTAFDRLTDRHGLEKIKTVGDAYMAVAGVPAPHADPAAAAADLALAMRQEAARRTAPNGQPLRLRIGIHSGPVVAGVIGTRKFAYDLWGDTVNVASRMESHGLPDAIQVTEATFQRLCDRYEFSPPRQVEVKGKGAMTTYLLLGRKAAAALPSRRT